MVGYFVTYSAGRHMCSCSDVLLFLYTVQSSSLAFADFCRKSKPFLSIAPVAVKQILKPQAAGADTTSNFTNLHKCKMKLHFSKCHMGAMVNTGSWWAFAGQNENFCAGPSSPRRKYGSIVTRAYAACHRSALRRFQLQVTAHCWEHLHRRCKTALLFTFQNHRRLFAQNTGFHHGIHLPSILLPPW